MNKLTSFFWDVIFPCEKFKSRLISFYMSPQFNLGTSNLELLSRLLIQNSKKVPYLNCSPYVFNLLEEKEGYLKLSRLLSLGFPLDIQNTEGRNLIQQVIYNFNNIKMSLSETIPLLKLLLHFKVRIFPENYSIYQYEKSQRVFFKSNVDEKDLRKKKIVENFLFIKNILPKKELLCFLFKSGSLNKKDRDLLEYITIQESIYSDIDYKQSSHYPTTGNVDLIESILKYGDVLKSDMSAYYILSNIFHLRIDEKFKDDILILCYQRFSNLKVRIKKLLTRVLIKDSREKILLSLLAYGLDLNWNIKDERGQEGIIAFKMLETLPMIEAVLASENFNICCSNKKGENILHLMGSYFLFSNKTKDLLDKKIAALSSFEKQLMFNQYDDRNLTPLLKAIYHTDDDLVNYLTSNGALTTEEIEGVDEQFSSPLNYISHLLSLYNNSNINLSRNDHVEYVNSFLYKYRKKWTSIQQFSDLNEKLNINNIPLKIRKI